MVHHHFLVVTFPAQGHINPCLQFAKRLIRMGVQVTLVTSVSAHGCISKSPKTPEGLKLASFSDAYDDRCQSGHSFDRDFSELRINSSQRLREITSTSNEEGCPITCLVYTFLLPWAAEVAHDCHIPSTLLWIQPATVFDIYYYYFNGYEEVITNNYKDPSGSIQLPGLPVLNSRDIPSILLPSLLDGVWLPIFKELIINILDAQIHPNILVNTFDALEPEALKALKKYNLIGVGPLIPSAFLDGRDPLDTSFGGDLFQETRDYVDWFHSKPESSVVYISFGTFVSFPKQQMEEIARGLLESHRPFLWVVRGKENAKDERLSCMEELEQQGKIVSWCSQVEILSHPSLGCFVTHCGWNSTLESLASGVAVVAFPDWTDQGTNAKMVEDVWKTGVRVRKNEEGIVESDEIKRCIEMVMGGEERGKEMRRNAQKWKDLAREAVKEGGSSDKNLKAFLEEVGGAF